jgi:hypothetical protein
MRKSHQITSWPAKAGLDCPMKWIHPRPSNLHLDRSDELTVGMIDRPPLSDPPEGSVQVFPVRWKVLANCSLESATPG